MRRAPLLLLLLFLGCKEEKRAAPDAGTAAPLPPASSTAPLSGPTAITPPAPTAAFDGGACRADVGPLALDFVGAPTLSIEGAEVKVIGNDKGTPHAVSARAASAGDLRLSSVPCAAAKGRYFCPDADGKIMAEGKSIAQSRAGTRVAAAESGGHAIVAYLKDKKTSEGMTQVAELWSEDGTSQALSDEGNGATFVDLAARDGQVIALTIDAHMGMTPVHARVIVYASKASLGPDAVLMVAGNAEAHTQGALSTRHDKGPSFALVPIAKDMMAFGMAAIRVEDPPKTDAPTSWSLYDNGLDPAPIAATHDGARAFVARLRPAGREPKSPRVLELGELTEGRFTPLGVVAGDVSSVAIAGDKSGVWIAYASDRAYVEHRQCP